MEPNLFRRPAREVVLEGSGGPPEDAAGDSVESGGPPEDAAGDSVAQCRGPPEDAVGD